MAETKDAHIVVEIPADDEHRGTIPAAIEHHPLAEISQSPGHFLLLKLWQREEDLAGRRMSRKESKKDAIGGEIFQLCCFFFVFHGLFLTILFTCSSSGENGCCKNKWWIPVVLSGCTSFIIVSLVQMKLGRYWKVDLQLQRERADGRALTRCIQELRMKGATFDLGKEPQNGKRLKSSSVEIRSRFAFLQIHPVFLIYTCTCACIHGAWKGAGSDSLKSNGTQTRNEAILVRFYSIPDMKPLCRIVESM